MLFRRARRLGWLHPLDRVLLALYARLVLHRRAADCTEVVEVRNAQPAIYDCPTLDVRTINDLEVVQLLRAIRPDLVVVLGTSIIRRPVLDSAPLFVNLHAGITPLYRGAHGCFWAAARRDYDNVGVTLHVVDSGIDTGAILEQTRIEFDPKQDNFVTLLAKAHVASATTIRGWIRNNAACLAGATRIDAPPGPSQLYYSPGIRDYLQFERSNRKVA
jgi:folate-dependent phosphoribosylglycinamide formyltransferase PurN